MPPASAPRRSSQASPSGRDSTRIEGVSDTPIDGWWRAKDGRWYPPETHPAVARGPVAPPKGWRRRPDGTWGPETDASPAPAEAFLPLESTMSTAASTTAGGADFSHLNQAPFAPRPPVATTPPADPTPPLDDAPVTVVRVERRGPSPRLLAGVALGLVVVLVGAWVLSRNDGDVTSAVDASDRLTTTSRQVRGTTSTTSPPTTPTTAPAPSTTLALTPSPVAPTTASSTTTTTTTTSAPTRRRRSTTTAPVVGFPVPPSPTTVAPPPTAAPTTTPPPTTAPPSTSPPTTAPPPTTPEPTTPDPLG